jgi:hypothetical protein
MRRSKKATQLAVSAKRARPGADNTSVIEKIAGRSALEALNKTLATAQANGPFPLGGVSDIAAQSKAVANDAVAMAERMQRHFAALDGSSRRS